MKNVNFLINLAAGGKMETNGQPLAKLQGLSVSLGKKGIGASELWLRPAQLGVQICVQNSCEIGAGQASFLIHILQQFLRFLEGISVKKSKFR